MLPPAELDRQREIVRGVLEGRTEEFAHLVRAYQDPVRRLCRHLVGSAAEADDAAQDVFVKAYTNLPSFRLESSFSTWLYRIAYHHCLDLLKSKRRRLTESLDALPERRLDFPAREPSGDPLTQSAVQSILARLLPEYRLVLTLRELQGLSYEEIAEATETSLDSVKARLRRARRALQDEARHFMTGPVVDRTGDR